MKRNKLLLIIFLVFVMSLSSTYFILNPKLTAFSSLSEEECINLGDDCWHTIAHQTFNREYCLRIIDNETKEHCLEHIPKNK